ncbi:MAG: type II toxin-antitoxin system VapC family toxin [Magnetococcales bacterium]|nr:type II toxin-antitoxin system VapC family toxin [Magnetococcales bacterium]
MSYLLDTVILSELRKRDRNPNVVTWVRSVRASDLFLSVVSIGEVERGIALQERDHPEFAADLAEWLETVLRHYGDRILTVNTAVARQWGQLSARLGHSSADLLIAATAMAHGLTVITRNVRHFEPTGVAVINPFISP